MIYNPQNEAGLSPFSDKLEFIINATNIGLWDWSLESGEIIYSKQWESMLGYREGELTGSIAAWEKTVIPEDLQKTNESIRRCLAGETASYEAEFRMKRKDGTIIWVQDKGVVTQRDETGKAIRMLGVLQDITIVKSAEAELKIKSERLKKNNQAMFDSSPHSCVIVDDRMRVVDCNPAALDFFGGCAKSFLLRSFMEIMDNTRIDMEDAEHSAMNMKECIRYAVGHAFLQFDAEVLFDGKHIPVNYILKRIPYGEGYAVAVYQYDIRKLKAARREIERQDALLRAVNTVASEMIFAQPEEFSARVWKSLELLGKTVDVDRVYIWKNREVDGVLYCSQVHAWSGSGMAPQQGDRYTTEISFDKCIPSGEETLARGDSINMIISDMPEAERALFEAQGILSILVMPIFMNDLFWGFIGFDDCRNARKFTDSETNILQSAGLMLASAMLRNETTRAKNALLKERESFADELEVKVEERTKELTEMTARAEEAVRVKTEFLANMSHEIRTPMNAILGMSEILSAETLSDEQKRYVDDIRISATSLLGIINDILDLSKIEEHKLKIVESHYHFPVFIDNIVSMIRFTMGDQPIELIVDIPDTLPQYLYGDYIRMRQVIVNLLGNAVKFTSRGFVGFSVTIGADTIVFEVKDSGIGIKPEDIARLFDPFEQFDELKNRTKSGTGLGLPIAKSLVEMMGGNISVFSVYGKGSTFRVEIPLVLGDKELAPDDSSAIKFIHAPGAKVLLVDDNPININVGTGLLKLCSIVCDAAENGQDAIDKVRLKDYDLVFMDHMMPVMDGVCATQKIREMGGKYEKLPIIALTANAVVGAENMFLKSGMNGFLPKPINTAELVRILAKWLPKEKVTVNGSAPEKCAPASDCDDALKRIATIPGLDIEKGLQTVGGDPKLYEESLQLQAIFIRQSCELMESCADKGDTEHLAIEAHGIKGSLISLGAVALSNLAKQLEQSAKNDNIEHCRQLLPRFIAQANSLKENLDKVFSAETAKPAGSAEMLKEIMLDLSTAFITLDSESAGDILGNALQYTFGPEKDSILRKIKQANDESDFNMDLVMTLDE